MKLIFKNLFLFSPSEKKAKKIDFIDGVNIITSSQEDGTDRGKSVIMRSLYHSLGAEGCFDKNWKTGDKVYILEFAIDEEEFYIYRSSDLYKFFDSNKKLLFTSVSSKELSIKLSEYTKFAVQLPNRSNKLEITPPAFNYLPFYLDQDHYAGNEYSSFKNLGQFTNFRENVLFYHLGAYDEQYFQLIRERDILKEHRSEYEEQINMLMKMIESLDKKIGGTSFSSDFEAMQRDVEMYKNEYAAVLEKMSVSKKKLIELRNSLYETEKMLKEVDIVSADGERRIKKLRVHKCPECGSTIKDVIQLKSREYNIIEDAIAIKNELQVLLLEDQQKIEKEETKYRELLEQLKEYEGKISSSKVEANNILKQKGMSDLRDDVVSDLTKASKAVSEDDDKISKVSKRIKEYSDKKKAIEKSYYEYMMAARTKFGINELEPESFKKLTNSVKASGSNKNVATIMWYISVLELRAKYNNDAIIFPIVFDSINNVETDNEKKYGLFQYVVDKSDDNQLVLSLLGYQNGDIKTDRPIKIITLTNEKYHLLDEKTFADNKLLLDELCDA